MVFDFVSLEKGQDAGLHDGDDGTFDDDRVGGMIEIGFNFVFESFAGGRSVIFFVRELTLDSFEALLRGPESRDLGKRCMAGDESPLGSEVADDGFKIRIFGYDMEVAVRVGGEYFSDFKAQDEIESIAALDQGLDDLQLSGMVLYEQKERNRKVLFLRPEDHENLGRLSLNSRKIGFADIFEIDEDILSAWRFHGREMSIQALRAFIAVRCSRDAVLRLVVRLRVSRRKLRFFTASWLKRIAVWPVIQGSNPRLRTLAGRGVLKLAPPMKKTSE